MGPHADRCEETRDDGRQSLTAFSAPSANLSSTINVVNLYSTFFLSVFWGGSIFYQFIRNKLSWQTTQISIYRQREYLCFHGSRLHFIEAFLI